MFIGSYALPAEIYNSKYGPCPLLANMVAAGKLGVKSGEGFYTYTAGGKELAPVKNPLS